MLAQVVAGQLTLSVAAERLAVSYRQAKRLYGRYRAEGPMGLRHKSVGRRSNRARAEVERAKILELVRTHYGGTAERGPGQRFGPTLVAEHLARDHGYTVATRWLHGGGSDAQALDGGRWSVEPAAAGTAAARASCSAEGIR